MTENNIQKQRSGDHSISIQGRSIIFEGISYSEARQIALDVYKANFLRLSNDAAKLAVRRAEELTDSFLSQLYKRRPEAISSMADPGMQMVLFEAQKEYARTGNKDLEKLLVDLLVDRASGQEQSDERIVLDESIRVVPKLTVIHLDSLSVVLLLTRSKRDTTKTQADFRRQIEETLVPFLDNLSAETSCYEHLEYAGCGSIMRVARWPAIEKMFAARFPDFFSHQSIDETRSHILEICPQLQYLFDIWPTSTISRFNHTTVGVSIAQANYRMRTGQRLQASSPLTTPYVDELSRRKD